jgi:hypothetical protein
MIIDRRFWLFSLFLLFLFSGVFKKRKGCYSSFAQFCVQRCLVVFNLGAALFSAA